MMNLKLVKVIISLLILLTVFQVNGQKKYQFFQISGRVKMDKGDPSGALVEVNNLETQKIEKSITVASLGKFDLQLNYQTEYKLTVSKQGYYSKDILISTLIPQNVWEKDSIFPPFIMVVTLFKKVNDVPLSFDGKTIGKISYSPNGTLDNFDSQIYIDDKDIRTEIDIAAKSLGEDEFNKKLASALEFEKNNDLKSAYLAYSEASKLRPNDKFVREKLKDLSSDLKEYLDELKLAAEFDRLISLGDANVTNKKYADAINNYKGALNLKPEDPTAKEKLAVAEGLLARVNAEKAKLEEEFNRLVAQGDDNVSKQLYNDAIGNYNGALKIKPGDAGVTAKLSSAEKLLAKMNADKAKLEADFSRLLALGDRNVKDQKYPEAIENYKGALNLKPEDGVAKEKLATTEGLLAKVNADKAKLEEEFNRLVVQGDDNVTKQLFNEAIGNYNGALKIKPGDAAVTAKLSSAEKLLAKLNADKAKLEADFSRLLALGDRNVKDQKYPEAIENYKGALNLKPEDGVAKEKLATTEGLLAKVNADKAKLEEEFNRLVLLGDDNVSKQLYNDAIGNYSGALKIKPADAGVTAKLSSAEKLLAKLNADKAKLEADFSRLLALGDKNVKDQKYSDAIENYKEALNLKPEDATAKEKLSATEGLLAKVNADKAKLEEEFNRLVAQGDDNVTKQLYNEAIGNYNGALKIKPGDGGVTAKLSSAEKLFAKLNADKVKLEADFSRLLALGDRNVKDQKYSDAIENYKEALNLKPEDATAKEKLSAAEGLLAKVNADKAKLEEEFSRLVAQGDDNVTKQLYNEAIGNYNGALKIKPGDAAVTAKLSSAEKLLAKLNADKAKLDADFSRLLALGDRNVKDQRYADAIENYKGALNLKPEDATAKEKLSAAEGLLAKINADKAKLEEELNMLLAMGDENVKSEKYSEALNNYKGALRIKDGNEIVLSKISEVQNLIRLKGAKDLAEAEKKRLYSATIDKADKLFNSKIYSDAKIQYLQATDIDRTAVYPQRKIAEIDSIIAKQAADIAFNRELEAKKQKSFDDLIKAGDEKYSNKIWNESLTAFVKASEIYPDNAYAKNKISEVKEIIGKEEKMMKDYQQAILRGDNHFNNKQYNESLIAFREAGKLKPDELLPKQRIQEIQSILDKIKQDELTAQKQAEASRLSANENSYKELISQGDDNFEKSQWTVSRFYYVSALKIKPDDKYALNKVEACDKMISSNITADKISQYKTLISRGDTENKLNNYTSARFYYRSSLEILPWESYPLEKLKEIDQIFAERLSQADQLLFKENLQKAEEAYLKKEYASARFYYNRANEINPQEDVNARLKQIEEIVSGGEAKRINSEYEDCIKKAEEAIQQNNPSIARFYYQKAISLKPNETYPAEQLRKLGTENR